jgi:hypothetical protein
MAVLLLKRQKTQRDCRDASWAPCSQGSKLTIETEQIAARKKKMGTNQRLSDAILKYQLNYNHLMIQIPQKGAAAERLVQVRWMHDAAASDATSQQSHCH